MKWWVWCSCLSKSFYWLLNEENSHKKQDKRYERWRGKSTGTTCTFISPRLRTYCFFCLSLQCHPVNHSTMMDNAIYLKQWKNLTVYKSNVRVVYSACDRKRAYLYLHVFVCACEREFLGYASSGDCEIVWDCYFQIFSKTWEHYSLKQST